MKASKYQRPSPEAAPDILQDSPGPAVSLESAAMVRTQIYLNRAEYEFLQSEARRRATPMAAVIRSFIDEKMQVPEDVWENNPLLAPPADPEFKGPVDGVPNHDHYVYGAPKKWVKRKGKWVEASPLPEDYHTNPRSAEAYNRALEEEK